MILLKNLGTVAILILFKCSLFSQLSIELNMKDIQLNPNELCYTIQLNNATTNDVSLAGQNYRIYYNTDQSLFRPTTLVSFLPESYTDFDLKQHFIDQDASGFGNLAYENKLGFINFSSDYNLDEKIITIKPYETFSTGEMCFQLKDTETLTLDIDWASDNTQGYATADVQISQYSNGKLSKVNISDRAVYQNYNGQYVSLGTPAIVSLAGNETAILSSDNADVTSRMSITEIEDLVNVSQDHLSTFCLVMTADKKFQNTFKKMGYTIIELPANPDEILLYRYNEQLTESNDHLRRASNIGIIAFDIFQAVKKDNNSGINLNVITKS